MLIYGKSDVGKVRENNEDVFIVSQKKGYAVVADGAGGHVAGEVAAMMTVQRLKTTLDELTDGGPVDYDHAVTRIAQTTRQASLEICGYSRDNLDGDHMGNTMVLAMECGGCFLISNLGDSRCYVYHENQLFQITGDHTMAQKLLDEGRISLEDYKKYPKNTLAGYVGTGAEDQVPTFYKILKEQAVPDAFLLCSDGLSGFISDDDIETILKSRESLKTPEGIKGVVDGLIQRTLETDARDNVTAVMMAP